MLSIPASCLEFHVCYERQILSYLSTAAQTRLYPEMFPCTSRLDCHPLTFYPENQTARGNVDKCFSGRSDFDCSLTIIISLTSPQARAMKSCRHTDPSEWALHCCFTTSWGVTLQYRTGLQMTNNDNEDVLQLDDSPQLNIRRWKPVYAHAGGHLMLIWSPDKHSYETLESICWFFFFNLQMESCRSWNMLLLL